MSYDTAGVRNTYSFPYTNNAAAVAAIRVPSGARFAVIEEISFGVGVALVGTTTPGVLQIGTAGSAAKFAAQNNATVAGLAAGLAYGTPDLDGRVAAYNPAATPSSTNKGRIDLLNDGDTAGTMLTALKLNFVAATGGTPSGSGNYHVVLRWF